MNTINAFVDTQSKADIAIQDENWPVAVHLLTHLNSQKEDVRNSFNLAVALYKIGDAGGARHYLEDLTRKFPGFSNAFQLLGIINFQTGMYERAFESFWQALLLDNQDLLSLSYLVQLQNNFPDALEVCISHEKIYAKQPVDFREGIPIFSKPSKYVENYELISKDHVGAIQPGRSNPFIPEEHWLSMELPTVLSLKKYVKKGDWVMDVGVGMGRVISHFRGIQKFGMDISFSYLPIAQKKGVRVCYSLIEEMPYKPNIFDIVTCTDVLEHVIDINRCLFEIIQTIKPFGLLIVRVPYRESLKDYVENCKYEFVHVRDFNEFSLMALFTKIFNCKVVEWTLGAKNTEINMVVQKTPEWDRSPLVS